MVDQEPEPIVDVEDQRRPFPWGFLFAFLLLLILGIFLAQNGTAVSVHLFKLTFESTLAMVSLIAFVTGLLVGLLLALVVRRRRRRAA